MKKLNWRNTETNHDATVERRAAMDTLSNAKRRLAFLSFAVTEAADTIDATGGEGTADGMALLIEDVADDVNEARAYLKDAGGALGGELEAEDAAEDLTGEDEEARTFEHDINEACAALWTVVAHIEDMGKVPAYQEEANRRAQEISTWCEKLRTLKKEVA